MTLRLYVLVVSVLAAFYSAVHAADWLADRRRRKQRQGLRASLPGDRVWRQR